MAKNFRELEKQMGPERVARSEARAKAILADMLLAEMRKQAGLTQEELAESVGVTQPTISQLEGQDDMQISTLRRIVEALGGQLEIIAHLPKGDISLRQFRQLKRKSA